MDHDGSLVGVGADGDGGEAAVPPGAHEPHQRVGPDAGPGGDGEAGEVGAQPHLLRVEERRHLEDGGRQRQRDGEQHGGADADPRGRSVTAVDLDGEGDVGRGLHGEQRERVQGAHPLAVPGAGGTGTAIQ